MFIPVTSKKSKPPLIDAIRRIGVSSGLQLCLDAGDANSYSSGTKWLDVSGNGYDFNFGAAGASPTFNGTAGRLSSAEYMSFDGGDYFTYDSANETWMDSLHKDNAVFSCAAWMYFATLGTQQNLFGTSGGSTANVGVDVRWLSSDLLGAAVRAGGTAALAQSSTLAASSGVWQFWSIAINEATGAGGVQYRRGTATDSDSSTYTTPSAAAATYPMQIGAGGNNIQPLLSGARIGMLAMWSGTNPTSAQMDALYHLTASRYL